MPLTDLAVRNAKAKDRPYKVTDGKGMYLHVMPNGARYWRFKFYFQGKEKLMSLGVYPEVTLAEAREHCLNARKMIRAGNNPIEVKQDAQRIIDAETKDTFENIAREWHESRLNGWSADYARKLMISFEQDVFPKIGKRPIEQINAPELLKMLRAIESRGALETTHRVKQNCGQVFMYAVATGRATRNPAPDLQMALKVPKKKNHAYLKEEELPEYLQKLENYDGADQTRLALKLLLLTFVRTTELRGALWSEIDFDKAEWRIPAERMKMKDQHIVPLSKQSLAVLKELQPITGHWPHLFANQHKPRTIMSENTILFALYRMGYHSRATGHGFRATASTILNEHGFLPDHIERQLAHCERNKIRAAYNHAQYIPERRKMMQWWGDYLDEVKAKAS